MRAVVSFLLVCVRALVARVHARLEIYETCARSLFPAVRDARRDCVARILTPSIYF